MSDEEKRSKQGQKNNKAKQHSTPKAVTFPKKNELPQVRLEPTILYTLDRALYIIYTTELPRQLGWLHGPISHISWYNTYKFNLAIAPPICSFFVLR